MDVHYCCTRSLKAELAEWLLATHGVSELEGTAQPPLPRLQPHPEPCSYSGPEGHYLMDNIIRQNQFYETPVIKQENESGYDRRPLDMEPQQQTYHPELKKEMRQEAPPSCPQPETLQLKTDRLQLQNRKNPFEENRGREYFEHQEDLRDRSLQSPAEEDEDDFDDTLAAIDTYNCYLHFKVAQDRSSGYPLMIEGFAYLWSGAHSSYGVRRGRACFDMKIKTPGSTFHLQSPTPRCLYWMVLGLLQHSAR